VGSRQDGWERLRERLKNVMKPGGPRLFVFNTCRQFIRAMAVLPRDGIDRNEVDNTAEEHGGRLVVGVRDERKKAGSAAALGIAFPAEQRALESRHTT